MWAQPEDVSVVSSLQYQKWFAPPFHLHELLPALEKWRSLPGRKLLSDSYAYENAAAFKSDYEGMVLSFCVGKWSKSKDEKELSPISLSFDSNENYKVASDASAQRCQDYSRSLLFYSKGILDEKLVARVVRYRASCDDPLSISWSAVWKVITSSMMLPNEQFLVRELACLRRQNSEGACDS